ncbi:MAG: ABC transporter ATP-binding protein [Thermofilaceae archaeon]|nr:ABC transporter ATP-binding protein [Thermofilaceae archaeon]
MREPKSMKLDNNFFIAKNISKSFGGLQALHKVSLSIPEASLTLMIGPNGSGKTTFLQIISGILKPDDGRLVFKDHDITSLPPNLRFTLGIASTFQIPRVFPSLSVLENVLMAAGDPTPNPMRALWGVDEHELIEKAFNILKLLSLDHLWNKPASTLSGGQMKLLELARSLMSDPKLLLLDEPLAGVNPALASRIMKFLTELKSCRGIAAFLVEHRLDLALKHVDFVYVLHHGRVISQGSPDDVLEDPLVAKAYLGE